MKSERPGRSESCGLDRLHGLAGPLHEFAAEFGALGGGETGGFDEMLEDEGETITGAKAFVDVLLHLRFEGGAQIFVTVFLGHKVCGGGAS